MSAKEDKKKMIGEYLKAADRSIQASEFTQAMIEVKKALDLEPGNMYALAYNQRIKAALESLKKKEEAARVKKLSDEKKGAQASAVKNTAPVAESVPLVAAAAAAADDSPVSRDDDRYVIKQQQAQIDRFKEEIESLRIKQQQEIAVLAEELTQSRAAQKEAEEKYQALVDDAEESYRRVEELYAEVVRLHEQQQQTPGALDLAARESLLRAVVSHVLLAETLSAEANDVMELIRTRLGFDDDEFVRLQQSVKYDIYRNALEKAWTEGYITPDQAEKLGDLRKKIGVSAESHFEIEAELRRAKKKR